MLKHYQKCINKIEDFFEYRYKSFSKEEIKDIVMGYIDQMVSDIEIEEKEKDK